jgi:hypothetical protein
MLMGQLEMLQEQLDTEHVTGSDWELQGQLEMLQGQFYTLQGQSNNWRWEKFPEPSLWLHYS